MKFNRVNGLVIHDMKEILELDIVIQVLLVADSNGKLFYHSE